MDLDMCDDPECIGCRLERAVAELKARGMDADSIIQLLTAITLDAFDDNSGVTVEITRYTTASDAVH